MTTDAGNTIEIDELQMDALRELGNVGASHASTALTELVKTDILIDVTECRVLPMDSLPNRFGELGELLATVKIEIGDTGSCIYMIFPEKIAIYLSDLLLGHEHDPKRPMSEEDHEVMVEMGDICIRRYLVPLSKFLSIDLIPNSPTVSVDKLEDRLRFPEVLRHLHDNSVVRIETNFVDSNQRFQGAIIYAPDPSIQQLTFKRFGVDAESQAAAFSKFGL
jgi:chemotaxis protein CheC